jgi:hypothetical protein
MLHLLLQKVQILKLFLVEGNHDDIIKHLPNKLFVRDGANSTSYFDGSEMKYFRKDPKAMHTTWDWVMLSHRGFLLLCFTIIQLRMCEIRE